MSSEYEYKHAKLHGFALKAIIKKTIHMTYSDIQYMCACTDKTVRPEFECNAQILTFNISPWKTF